MGLSVKEFGDGRLIAGATPFGSWSIELDAAASGKPLRVIDAAGNEVGRGTFTIDAPPPAPPKKAQPGDLLAVAIHRMTGSAPCGTCNERRRQMNQWGWWGCWKRRDTIAGWLAEDAAKRGHAIDKGGAVELLRAAWREVRAKP